MEGSTKCQTCLDVAWNILSVMAWNTRANARILGKTRVGCALLTMNGHEYAGCNIEHKYRSHDIHAETNTISTMVAKGDEGIDMILIVAERDQFTPCGSCMDWIFEIGGANTIVGFQNERGGKIELHTAGELMPFYPR